MTSYSWSITEPDGTPCVLFRTRSDMRTVARDVYARYGERVRQVRLGFAFVRAG